MKRPALAPLVPLYTAAMAARNAAYARQWKKAQELKWPVISVGSIVAGGAGKTPLVIRLAQLLQAAGYPVDVLSRGYGRAAGTVERVNLEGSPRQFGDEPMLIARNAGVPVYVGASRYAAGVLAESEAGHLLGIHLLDDGFQHRRLKRDLDIVLVSAADLNDSMLPAGNLREPTSSLERAGILAIRDEEWLLEPMLRARGLTQPIWTIHRKVVCPPTGARPLVFCGIARPEGLWNGIQSQCASKGLKIAQFHPFPDHHVYKRADVQMLVREAKRAEADCFLTTEKDAVKLDGGLRGQLESLAPLGIVQLAATLDDEPGIIGTLLSQANLLPDMPARMRE
jgi:tetraacyldisaccharide 4'-kinase